MKHPLFLSRHGILYKKYPGFRTAWLNSSVEKAEPILIEHLEIFTSSPEIHGFLLSICSEQMYLYSDEVEAFFHALVYRMFYQNFYMRLLLNCIIWISSFKKAYLLPFFFIFVQFFSPCLICSKLHNIGNMKKCWAWERMILHAFFNGVLSDDLNFIK